MDNNINIVCDNCEGTDFTTERGFYFCTECHKKSKDIQQRVYEVNDTVHVLGKKIKIHKDPSVSHESKLTSWETCNIILYGLVQELQTLGADDKFKDVTYHLWMQYLTKLEYITENSNIPATLGASYKKFEAEMVYHRKRSSSVSNLSVSDLDNRMKYTEKRKQMKHKEQVEYELLSQTLNSDTLSLATNTLSGLSSDNDSSSIAGHIDTMPDHLKLHMQDNNEMTCHKINRKFIASNYFVGPEVLTRNKLYCVLYLALLLSQQEIQISDIIRYCREGHLSFLDYTHFFSNLVNVNIIDHTVYTTGRKEIPSYKFMRTCSFQLFQYLDLLPCELSPNILRLCRRYCTELNLPDQICNIACDYIFRTRPFQTLMQTTCIPNYEGRAMGFIIYVLKVLFGFDDVTEYELSKFAHLVNVKNEQNFEPQELFNFSDWFHYLEYRKTVLKHVHFPTWHVLHPDEDCPSDLFTNFIYNKNDICEKEPELIMSIAKKTLTCIEVLRNDNDDKIEFEPSFTPCRSNLEKLKTIENFEILNEKLNLNIIKDASKHSIKYLIEPKAYLEQINAKKCSIIFNNAHSNMKFKILEPYNGDFFQKTIKLGEQKWDEEFATQKSELLAFDRLMSKILDKQLQNTETTSNFEGKIAVDRDKKSSVCKKSEPSPQKFTPKRKKCYVSSGNQTSFKTEHNPSLLHQIIAEEEQRFKKTARKRKEKHLNTNSKYKYHYIPRMEYCSNIQDVSHMTKEKYKEFEETLPKNLQWLLQECSRVIEQPSKDLYQEFVSVEVYMNYIYFNQTPVISKPLSNNKAINKLIRDVTDNW